MGSDDDSNVPKPPPGNDPGRPGLDAPEGGRGNDTQKLKTVRLVCLFCREVRVIHVPAECDTPKEVLWECLACQERWGSRK